MNNNFSCGDRIRELRSSLGLSQERLALNAGITPAYLGLVERGKRNATVATIEKLCFAMNISLADFFASVDKASPKDKIDEQIICRLVGLSSEEKNIILRLINDINALYSINKTPETE